MYFPAVFNDRPARARKVNIHVAAFVHSELSTCDHDGAILDVGDVRCSLNIATN
jgi:hypothetical protein